MIASRCCRLLRINGTWQTAASPPRRASDPAEGGYALLAVLVAVFLVLLALSVAAPLVSRALRRDREQEAVHRADQYVRAIQLYYRKFGHYPGSLDQLEKSNNIRFLRQRYPDPFTGKPDWRLIKVGENKTTVKGFFGQPLAGINSTGLGANAGSVSAAGVGSSPASMTGASTGTGTGSVGTFTGADGNIIATTGGTGADTGSSSPTSALSSGSSNTTSSTSSPLGAGIGSQSATSFSGTGAPFLGVGIPAPGTSILAVNEKTTYPEWEFLYDPRIEQLRSKVNLLGGGMGATGSSLGTASGMTSPMSTSPVGGSTPSSSPTSNGGSGTGFGSSGTPLE